jgi:hypothetical protein
MNICDSEWRLYEEDVKFIFYLSDIDSSRCL